MHEVHTVRVKICGLMRRIDVEAAVASGADAVGFVVASPSSKRNLSPSAARRIMKSANAFTTRVCVTSADSVRKLNSICREVEPDALQLHRHTKQLVENIRKRHPGIRLILASGIRDQSSLSSARRSAAYADAVLADSPSATSMGGTGQTHDWALTASLRDMIKPRPLILAGGLTPTNVRQAVRTVKPYAVDVSTGVERKIGIKDHDKIREFVQNAKEAMM